MFNVGDKVKLLDTASGTYKQYFKMETPYTVFEKNGHLVVFVNNEDGLHGAVEVCNWILSTAIHVGGE